MKWFEIAAVLIITLSVVATLISTSSQLQLAPPSACKYQDISVKVCAGERGNGGMRLLCRCPATPKSPEHWEFPYYNPLTPFKEGQCSEGCFLDTVPADADAKSVCEVASGVSEKATPKCSAGYQDTGLIQQTPIITQENGRYCCSVKSIRTCCPIQKTKISNPQL